MYCTGFVPAIVKSLGHGPIFDHRRPYELLRDAQRDTLVIWVGHVQRLLALADVSLQGTADAVVPFKGLSDGLMSLLGKRATLHPVNGGSHDLPTTNHAQCTPVLVAFFQ